MRRLFYDLLAMAVIALIGAFAVQGLGMAQPPVTEWTKADIQYQIESPKEAEDRRAKGRAYAEIIRRVYGQSAPTAPSENATVYDYDKNDYQVFLGGFRMFGDPAGEWATVQSETKPASCICGREEHRGSLRILITCPDWPAIRRLTGSTVFPTERGQQVFVRTSDPAIAAFSITLRYRKYDTEHAVTHLAAVHPKYDSGAGWVLGDVEIVAVEVVELRESLKTAVQ